jgi:phage portal protein BeeE
VSLFFGQQRRAITSVPWDKGGPRLRAAQVERQLCLVPVFAAVRLISDSISTLPLQQFRRVGDGRAPMPLARTLEAPSAYGTRVEWVQRALVSALATGNAYGIKTGVSVEWQDPTLVQDPEDGSGDWLVNGRRLASSDILHIPALVVPGQRAGISPLHAAREAIDAGLRAQEFTRDWFENRAVPGMVLKNEAKTLDDTQATAVKDRMKATLRSGEPFVTGKDWALDVLKLPAEDAGFVAATKLTATQVANIYGIPPEMIGGEVANSLTYSTVELNQIAFLTNTLRPWIVRLEAALSSLLPQPQFVKFNVDALLRVDTKTRWETHKIRREIGATNIDEIRALEDEDPLPDDKGQDYTPLAKVGAAPIQEDR